MCCVAISCGGAAKRGSICNSSAECAGSVCVESQCVALQHCSANDGCATGICSGGVCWSQACGDRTSCPYGTCQNGFCIGTVTSKPDASGPFPYVCDFSADPDTPGCIEFIGLFYTSSDALPVVTDNCVESGGTLVMNSSCSSEGRIGTCNWLPDTVSSYRTVFYGDSSRDLSPLVSACEAAGNGSNWTYP